MRYHNRMHVYEDSKTSTEVLMTHWGGERTFELIRALVGRLSEEDRKAMMGELGLMVQWSSSDAESDPNGRSCSPRG